MCLQEACKETPKVTLQQTRFLILNQKISEIFNTEHWLRLDKKGKVDTVFAVESKGETVFLLFQLDMTLFHCLLQSCQRLKYGLNTLTHKQAP